MKMKNLLKRIWVDEEGQDLTESASSLALIAPWSDRRNEDDCQHDQWRLQQRSHQSIRGNELVPIRTTIERNPNRQSFGLMIWR